MDCEYEAEKALLGAVLLGQEESFLVLCGMKPYEFGISLHRLIVEAALDVGLGCDLVSVSDWLNRHGKIKDMAQYGLISDLTQGIPRLSTAQAQHYCSIIRESYQKRAMARLAKTMMSQCEAGKTGSEVAELAATSAQKVKASMDRKRSYTAKELAQMEEKDVASRVGPRPDGFRWSIPGLAAFTSDLDRGSLWIVASRPRIGKSTFLAGAIVHNLIGGRRILHFACEMGPIRNVWRILSVKSEVPVWNIKHFGKQTGSENKRYLEAFAWLQGMNHYRLVDHPGIRPSQIRAEVRTAEAVMGGRLDAVVIDYFQLLAADQKYTSRRDEGTEILSQLVEIGSEHRVPVILGAQLNRNAETDKKDDVPSLSELKDTGSLEEKASGVLLLHRWNLLEHEDISDAKIIVAKQQDGGMGSLDAHFHRYIPKWTE